MDIDNLLQNLLALLLSHMEIHLQKQFIARNAPVHKSQVLRDNLIEDKTSHSGLDDSCLYGAVRHLLAHPDLYSGVEGHRAVLVGQNRLIGVLKAHALSLRAWSLLGQVVDAQNHILRRNSHRTAVRRL